MKNQKNPANFEPLGQNFYIVRTQAGFRKAVRHYNGGDKPPKGTVLGYPHSYPSFVSFSDYQGFSINVSCIHLKRLASAIKTNEETYLAFNK